MERLSHNMLIFVVQWDYGLEEVNRIYTPHFTLNLASLYVKVVHIARKFVNSYPMILSPILALIQ